MSETQKVTNTVVNAGSIAGGFKGVTLQEEQFILGNSYTVADYDLDVGTDAEIDFLFDPTGCSSDTQVIAEVPVFNASAGPVTIAFYLNPVVTDTGSELTAYNRRTTSTNTNSAKLYKAPTLSDDGTRFTGLLCPATSTGAGQSTGNVTLGGLPFEVDCSLKLLIRVKNLNGAGSDIGYKYDWTEAPVT